VRIWRKSRKGKKKDVRIKTEFISEVIGKPVVIEVGGKEPIAGMIVDNSKFWIKFQNVIGMIVYLNKAYLKTIIPLKKE